MTERAEDGYLRLVVRMEQGQLRVIDAREVDGPLIEPVTVTHGLAHELLVRGRRVAVGSLPDAAVARSFSEIGPEGPREHHTQALDTYDFVIRVRRSAARGDELSDLSVDLVSVTATRGNALVDLPFALDPSVDVTPVASLTNLAESPTPTSLRRIIEADDL